jgi:FkbH-like protein
MNFLETLDFINSFEKENKNSGQEISINFLRNFTIENILPFLKYHFYNSQINPIVNFGGYNNMIQEVLDGASHLNSQPKIVVLAMSIHEFAGDGGLYDVRAEKVINELDIIIQGVIERTQSTIVINNFLLPFHKEFGIANVEVSLSKEIDKINGIIQTYLKKYPSRIFLVDLNRLVGIIGEINSIDYRFWYSSRTLFKNDLLDLYAKEITKIGKALLGKSKKVLVLDCDNTLWGGIIGEDGIEGITLSKNTYPGNIYYAFQETVIKLYERGVIITLCSKNNEDDVWEVLANHPDCLLKKKHLAGWRVNWRNKVDNIIELSEELNIGLDYFVFVDDNPVECNLVKERLPLVEMVQVPEKIYTYPDILFKESYFDTLQISSEDKARNELYQAEMQRKESKRSYSDITDYFKSLDIELTIGVNKSENIVRLAQLTQKTNQFNLTTRRYSDGQITALLGDPNSDVYYFAVKDKFGDMGITGMLIAKQVNETVVIDNFLLSCRILGRNIEMAFIDYCLKDITQRRSPAYILADYIPTKKNMQTSEFWSTVGFQKKESSNGITSYSIKPAELKKNNFDYIKLKIL